MGTPGGRQKQTSSEKIRIEFLDRELELCQTFLDTAELEAHDPERCAAAERNARKGYDTVLTWIATVRDEEALQRLNAKLGRLRDRLEERSS
jgi:hypothetical protein